MAKLNPDSIPTRWKRAHGKSLKAMLSQEARARGLVKAIVRQSAAQYPGNKLGAATAVERGLAAAILHVRRGGRDAGGKALEGELRLAQSDGVLIEPGFGTTGAGFGDIARAQHISRKFAAAWYRKTEDGLDATVALDSRLDTIAITETADSFNDEREAIMARTVQREPDRSYSVVLVEFWDATGDRRTCSVCERADGTFVPLGVGFGAGRPGGVHPRCRCNSTVIPLPVWMTRDLQADDSVYDYEEAA